MPPPDARSPSAMKREGSGPEACFDMFRRSTTAVSKRQFAQSIRYVLRADHADLGLDDEEHLVDRAQGSLLLPPQPGDPPHVERCTLEAWSVRMQGIAGAGASSPAGTPLSSFSRLKKYGRSRRPDGAPLPIARWVGSKWTFP